MCVWERGWGAAGGGKNGTEVEPRGLLGIISLRGVSPEPLLSPGLGQPEGGAGCLRPASPSLWRIELGSEMNFSSTDAKGGKSSNLRG